MLPSAEEQARLNISVVPLPATIHNEMWDGANAAQKAEILRHVDRFVTQLR